MCRVDGERIIQKHSGFSYSLVLKDLRDSDAGDYECQFTSFSGATSSTRCTLSADSCASMRKKVSKLASISGRSSMTEMGGLMKHMEQSLEQTTSYSSSRASSIKSSAGEFFATTVSGRHHVSLAGFEKTDVCWQCINFISPIKGGFFHWIRNLF